MPALDTRVPDWLVEQSAWYGSEQRQQQNTAFYLKTQEASLNLASQALKLQEQEQVIDLNKIKINQMSQGSQDVAEWMKNSGGDPVWMVNNPYTGTNPMAAQTINDVQIRASQSLKVQKAKEDLAMFNKRLVSLAPDSRAAIQGMSDDPRTGLPTADKWRALSLAEEAEQVRAQNEREQAALEAQQAGAVPTTTVRPSGVTTTYKQPTAGQQVMAEPGVKEFPDGSKLIHVSPNRWQYVKGEKQQDFSASQLLAIADALGNIDQADPRIAIIKESLAEKAVKQIGSKPAPGVIQPPSKPAPAPAPVKPASDPLGLFQ